jgi:hypothetical protein
MKISTRSINKTINLINRRFNYNVCNMSDGYFYAMDCTTKKYVSFTPFIMGEYWFCYYNGTHQVTRIISTSHDLNELKKLIKTLF